MFNGRAIYNPAGKAGEYAKWACNFYVGCSNGCKYCYCKKGILAGVMGQNTPQLKKCFKDKTHALEVFKNELEKNIVEIQKTGLFFSFTTDPLAPETIDLTVLAVDICLQNNINVILLTKCTHFLYLKNGTPRAGFAFLIDYKHRQKIAFGFSLTGCDELEPGAPSNNERIETMKALYRSGFKVWASIEPVINFADSMRVINKVYGYCDLFKIGLLSGEKNTYELKKEALFFIEWLNRLTVLGPKFHIKKSIQKLTNYTNEELSGPFVGSDFDLFQVNLFQT